MVDGDFEYYEMRKLVFDRVWDPLRTEDEVQAPFSAHTCQGVTYHGVLNPNESRSMFATMCTLIIKNIFLKHWLTLWMFHPKRCCVEENSEWFTCISWI